MIWSWKGKCDSKLSWRTIRWGQVRYKLITNLPVNLLRSYAEHQIQRNYDNDACDYRVRSGARMTMDWPQNDQFSSMYCSLSHDVRRRFLRVNYEYHYIIKNANSWVVFGEQHWVSWPNRWKVQVEIRLFDKMCAIKHVDTDTTKHSILSVHIVDLNEKKMLSFL